MNHPIVKYVSGFIELTHVLYSSLIEELILPPPQLTPISMIAGISIA